MYEVFAYLPVKTITSFEKRASGRLTTNCVAYITIES